MTGWEGKWWPIAFVRLRLSWTKVLDVEGHGIVPYMLYGNCSHVLGPVCLGLLYLTMVFSPFLTIWPTHVLASIVECLLSSRPVSKQKCCQKGFWKSIKKTRPSIFHYSLLRNSYCPDEIVLSIIIRYVQKPRGFIMKVQHDMEG